MRVRVAACLIRAIPHYRNDAFVTGLRRAGFHVTDRANMDPAPGDVLVIWNRYGLYDMHACRYEKAGATVLIAENGWIGADERGSHLFALCHGGHNGAGTWHVGDHDRWAQLGIELEPWRRRGRHILVLPQRGIGPPGVAMPMSWPATVTARLKLITDRPIVVRPHPGNRSEAVPLIVDLRKCWAAVTWASGAGIKAIVAGVPVFHEMPSWIGAGAARRGIDAIEDPFLGDRLPMLRRLAWAQWTATEIATGEPFVCLTT